MERIHIKGKHNVVVDFLSRPIDFGEHYEKSIKLVYMIAGTSYGQSPSIFLEKVPPNTTRNAKNY